MTWRWRIIFPCDFRITVLMSCVFLMHILYLVTGSDLCRAVVDVERTLRTSTVHIGTWAPDAYGRLGVADAMHARCKQAVQKPLRHRSTQQQRINEMSCACSKPIRVRETEDKLLLYGAQTAPWWAAGGIQPGLVLYFPLMYSRKSPLSLRVISDELLMRSALPHR